MLGMSHILVHCADEDGARKVYQLLVEGEIRISEYEVVKLSRKFTAKILPRRVAPKTIRVDTTDDNDFNVSMARKAFAKAGIKVERIDEPEGLAS